MHDMLSITSSAITLEGMNACRIFLQVTFLSDTTNTAGKLSFSASGKKNIQEKK